jgi:sugar phosphate isomerase/epimerase
MKLSLCIQTPDVEPTLPVALLSGSFADKVNQAARLGYDGLELMVVAPVNIKALSLYGTMADEGLEVSAIASGGLAFAAGLTLLSPNPRIAAQARQRLSELIVFAKAMYAPVVTIGSFRGRAAGLNQAANDPQAGRKKLVEILQSAGEEAEELGVRLALEALNRYEADLVLNVAEGLELLEEVGRPAVGLLVDSYHVNIEETSYDEPFRRALEAGKLYHVHLGDSNRLPPGQGHIDFAAVVSTLEAGNYAGYLSAELLPRPDPDTAARQTIEFMKRLIG